MAKDGKPAFKYHGRSDESVARRAKESAGSYDSYVKGDVLWYKSKEGENCIRILPRSPDEDFDKWGDHWGIDIYIHYNVGPDNGTYLCTDKMKGEPCPVCEARRNIEDQEEADQLKPSRRILCWLIDRSSEKDGPKLWSMPHGTSKDISAVSQVKGTGEVLLIDDPENGYDVYFDREGEKKRTKYKRIEVSRDSSPVHDDVKVEEKWLNYIMENPLPDILEFFDADHVEKVLFGQGGGKDKDDEGGGRSRDRGRGREPAEETEPERRGGSRRGREPEAEEPARGRRGGRGEEADAEEPDNRRGGRGREREPEPETEPEPPRGGRGRRGEPESEPDAEEPPARTTRRGREPEAEAEAEPPTRGRTERRRPAAAEGEADPEPEADTSTKGRLSRLGRRGGR